MKYTQQSHQNIHGCPCRLCLRALTKPFSLDMQLTVLRSLHTSASHRDCTDRARDAWWKERVDTRRLSPSQGSFSSMDGECSLPSLSQPTCPKPKMCRTEVRRAQKRQKRRMKPDNLRKRHETYLQQHIRIKQKTAPTRAVLPSGHVNTSKYWWKGTAKSFTRCTWPPENIHNKANVQQRASNSSNPLVAHLPKITPELTSELLHCLTAIPDPWPMAKIAIDMEKPAQWVTKMCRLYFADIYARKTEGIPKAYPAPGVESTLQEVQQFLPDLEAKMIEFLAEWIVTLLSPATQIVKARASHLTFMFVKEYWFREFYLGLKVTASLGREESYTRIIDGQVRCITQEHIQKRGQLIWNVEFLTIFVPAWMIPPIYHSLRRECIKNAAHSHPYGVRSVRPTWFEDWKIPSQPDLGDPSSFQPMHGLKLVIKEDVMPQAQMPHFPAIEKLAANGFLAVETWNNKRAMLNFKATIEVPMLGTMIESCGDTLDESHMPLGWPLSIDGAVRQFCMHKRDTIQELNGMLAEFNLQRSSVEINRNTTLWSHNSVWNKKYMDPYAGYTLQQLWDASEHYICRKASRSREVTEEAILQMVRGLQHLPRASPPNNLFVQYLGRPQREQAPPQNAALTRRALEEWERTLCENKAVSILEKLQEGRPALFQKDGGAMLIAIVLDRPLQEAQDLVDQPLQFLQEIKRVLEDKKSHPVLERMLRTIQGDAAKQEATSSKERLYYTGDMDDNQFQ